MADLAEVKRQMAATVERADAADRRVALELERERTARAKAERHTESVQKSLDAAREANSAASEQTRLQLDSARYREEVLNSQLAASATELALERQRLTEQRVASEATAADAKIPTYAYRNVC